MKKVVLVFLLCFIMALLILNNNKKNIIDNPILMNNDMVTNQEEIKNALYNGLLSGDDEITMYCNYDTCLDDFHMVYDNNLLMSSISNHLNPYNLYNSMQYQISINNNHTIIRLFVDKKYTKEQIKEIDSKIDNYLNKLDLNKMSIEEKIKWAHDFIIDRNCYDKKAQQDGFGDAYSAYGAIVGNKAICQGYAEAMAVLLNKFDIPNIMISNNDHIWNLVNINGEWLHLDATWDDPILLSGKDTRRYDYFLISSKKLSNLDSSLMHYYDENYYLETLSN